mmetsp:Transcript_121271/g.387526  ORF Transcript_121271/g.387526 Transcript_121271/m.387526 type:complete len:217 (-) Transcript_121271:111-761(-)
MPSTVVIVVSRNIEDWHLLGKRLPHYLSEIVFLFPRCARVIHITKVHAQVGTGTLKQLRNESKRLIRAVSPIAEQHDPPGTGFCRREIIHGIGVHVGRSRQRPVSGLEPIFDYALGPCERQLHPTDGIVRRELAYLVPCTRRPLRGLAEPHARQGVVQQELRLAAWERLGGEANPGLLQVRIAGVARMPLQSMEEPLGCLPKLQRADLLGWSEMGQ